MYKKEILEEKKKKIDMHREIKTIMDELLPNKWVKIYYVFLNLFIYNLSFLISYFVEHYLTFFLIIIIEYWFVYFLVLLNYKINQRNKESQI